MSEAQQILFPWGQYKTSELARVLGVSRGRVLTALKHAGIIVGNVRGKGIPADQTEAVRAELAAVEVRMATVRQAAAQKRADREERRAAKKARAA